MPKDKFKDIQNDLHISHSQIFTYQNCSLKYFYQYVSKESSESVSINLFFGSAIHSALELYYKACKNGNPEALESMVECFENSLVLDIESADVPILYSKAIADKDAVIEKGKSMLEVFYSSVDLTGFEVVAAELPLSATLYTDEGEPTDFKLVGIIDLILKNKSGDLLVVDNKTAARSMNQNSADEDTQMTSYSYLLATNKYIAPTASVECQFDVLLKTKAPKFQQVNTIRTREDRKRFSKIANMVLAGIDAQIFMPVKSWLCTGCQFSETCSQW